MTIRIPILALCAATFAGGAFAYGVDVRAALGHQTESTCVPINSRLFRMRQPDGVERIFVRDRTDPNRLHCTVPPWLGAVRPERRMINIFTAPDFKGEKTEFCFVDGVLRFMSVGKKDYEFPPGCFAAPTNAVASLWPSAELTEEEEKDNDMWRGGGRLRLFSKNPNRAALIFAELAMVALGIALFARSGFWRLHGVLWTLISALLLLQAQSRGGFLAFLAGSSALLFFRWRRGMGRRMLIALAVIVLLLGGFAVASKVGTRMTVGIVQTEGDHSSQSRMLIWKEIPRMISAAPFGWGLWKSGPAYNSWFEKPENMHMIGDLFNDHFSRIVEGGFVCGGAYVFLWAFVLVWGWRLGWRGGSPVALAVCAAYFVASSFNPMNYWTPGFSVPAAVLAWGMWTGKFMTSGKDPASPLLRLLVWAGGVTAVVLAGVAVVAWMAPEQDVPLRVGWQGRRVIVGKGEPQVWLADDGFVLSGDYYGFPGKEIRAYYREHPDAEPLGIVTDLRDLPEGIDRLVVTGKLCVPYVRQVRPLARHVILLTPPFGSDTIAKNLVERADLHILTGGHVARLTGDEGTKNPRVHAYPGAEVYVPGWLDVVVRKGEK